MAPTYKQRYYTPLEVEQHSSSKDLWVSFLGKVYNLTPLVEKNGGKLFRLCNFVILRVQRIWLPGNNWLLMFILLNCFTVSLRVSYSMITILSGNILLKPILNAGGKDISHWFNTNGTNVSE